MLEMNTKTIRFFARMGARGTLGQAVYDYLCDGNDAFVLSADLAYASGFERIMKEFPEKFVDVGIAEQNLIGVAAGLARTGIPAVATSWAMFVSARAADQVRNFMGYMQSNVKLIGMDSGFVQSRFSYSHSNPPDIAIMRAIPGITILSPCDGMEIYKAINAALRINGPVYIRLTGEAFMPIVHKDPGFSYAIGRAITVKEGTDIAFVACGNAVKNAMDAAEILAAQGISAKVIDMHTISPLDEQALSSLSDCHLVMTVEEHLLHGGLGGAVAEFFSSQRIRPRHIMAGVDNCYPKPGSPRYTEAEMQIRPEQLAERALNELKGE